MGTGPYWYNTGALLHPFKSSCAIELQLNVSMSAAKALTPTPLYSLDTLTKGLYTVQLPLIVPTFTKENSRRSCLKNSSNLGYFKFIFSSIACWAVEKATIKSLVALMSGKTLKCYFEQIITVCRFSECKKYFGEITWCWQWLNATASLHSSSSILGLTSSRHYIATTAHKPLELNSTGLLQQRIDSLRYNNRINSPQSSWRFNRITVTVQLNVFILRGFVIYCMRIKKKCF